MKVALFSRYPTSSNTPRGGIESVTVVLVKALAKQGDVDVHLITLECGLAAEVTERKGDVTIHRLPGSGWPQIIDILTGPGRRRLLRKIHQLAPDVVHSHETFGLTFGDVAIPHVFTVHGFDHANIPAEGQRLAWIRARLWKKVEAFGLARQKHIISISPYVWAMIKPQTAAMIHYIDNPVDERFFKIQRCEEAGRVLCAGWINERKNTLGSVEAFAAAMKQGCSGTLAIAGEAKSQAYLDRVTSAIDINGIANHVEFLGHVSHDRLTQELARASVLLLPSLQENAPMAIAEAMAAGVPVIASNRCGMPFMIDEGKSGFLVDPTNSAQITDRLGRVVRSRELRERMGKTGREIALARFHPDVVARKTREVYASIVQPLYSKQLA